MGGVANTVLQHATRDIIKAAANTTPFISNSPLYSLEYTNNLFQKDINISKANVAYYHADIKQRENSDSMGDYSHIQIQIEQF